MQTISPFMHGHVEADTPAQGHGLHMHIEGLMQIQDHVHTFKNLSAPTHTVNVVKALVKNVESLPLPLFAVLFVLCLSVLISKFSHYSYIFNPLFIPSLRSTSRPRAPPAFLK